jgi:formate dehydrogenase iron-sulfur subunit
VEVIDRIIANQDRMKNLEVLDDLCELMLDGSLCALGGLTPYPVLSAVQHFPEDFDKPAAMPPSPVTQQGQETPSWR